MVDKRVHTVVMMRMQRRMIMFMVMLFMITMVMIRKLMSMRMMMKRMTRMMEQPA